MIEKEYFINIFGKTPIEKPINVDNEISVAHMRVLVDRVEEDKTNNKITYKAKSLGEVIIKEGDKVIKSKPKKGSQSQKLRSSLYKLWEEQSAGEMDFETYYSLYMSKLIKEVEDKLI